MKAKDWQKAAQLVQERLSQAAITDTSELSSFSLSELPVDQSGTPTVIHRPYVSLSTNTPVCVPSDYQQTTEAAQNESPINTSISPSIPFSRRVINDIEECQRRVL